MENEQKKTHAANMNSLNTNAQPSYSTFTEPSDRWMELTATLIETANTSAKKGLN